jgi:hypothetical protein
VGGGPTAIVADGQSDPFGIAVDASNVYWTNYDLDGRVMKVPIAGGNPMLLASRLVYPARVDARAGTVYWATWTNQCRSGAIMKVPIGGGEPTVLATGQTSPDCIPVDATSVNWTSYDSQSLMRLTPK